MNVIARLVAVVARFPGDRVRDHGMSPPVSSVVTAVRTSVAVVRQVVRG